MTAWLPLVKEPFKGTTLWDGKLGDMENACVAYADVTECKDGWIKISFRGWTPYGAEANVTLKDEPGAVTWSRSPRPRLSTAMHVAIFIGL